MEIDLGNAIGKCDGLQRRTVAECPLTDRSQRFGKRNLGQTGAAGKSIARNHRYAFWNHDGCGGFIHIRPETVISRTPAVVDGERVAGTIVVPVLVPAAGAGSSFAVDHHITGTAIEGGFIVGIENFNFCNAGRNIDGFQVGKIPECPVGDISDTVGNQHRFGGGIQRSPESGTGFICNGSHGIIRNHRFRGHRFTFRGRGLCDRRNLFHCSGWRSGFLRQNFSFAGFWYNRFFCKDGHRQYTGNHHNAQQESK